MKYYIIAGEASGDLHASNLMKAIKQTDTSATFRCWGGDRMVNEGGVLVKHYKDLAFMGFLEVIFNLRTIFRNIDLCKKDLLSWKPDALILIDYPGFNLRIAEFGHKNHLRVFYYISPQVWAWKKSRVHQIKRVVERMFVILPFEKDFYAKYNVDVDFVGHPLLDAIIPVGPLHAMAPQPHAMDQQTHAMAPDHAAHQAFIKRNDLSGKPIIAVLPGSRKQEITRVLPEMMKIWKFYKLEYQWVIAGMHSTDPELYIKHIAGNDVKVIYDQTYDLLRNSHAALVTSGTASLEAALLRIPQVICYKGSPVSFAIAKRIVDIKYIGLPNLIMDREVVTELLQADLNETRLIHALDAILFDENNRKQMLKDYEDLHSMLGGEGASGRTAELILNRLKEGNKG